QAAGDAAGEHPGRIRGREDAGAELRQVEPVGVLGQEGRQRREEHRVVDDDRADEQEDAPHRTAPVAAALEKTATRLAVTDARIGVAEAEMDRTEWIIILIAIATIFVLAVRSGRRRRRSGLLLLRPPGRVNRPVAARVEEGLEAFLALLADPTVR